MTSRDPKGAASPSRGGVLDPRWEDELRAGLEADGGGGSVEAELAVVHLLRHARAPEPLGDRAQDAVWEQIDRKVSPTPWWRRPWVLWAAPALAAAAVLAVMLIPRGRGGPDGADGMPSLSPALALAQQFEILEPAAREALAARVDDGRALLRGQLVAAALRAGTGSVGGAP